VAYFSWLFGVRLSVPVQLSDCLEGFVSKMICRAYYVLIVKKVKLAHLI